MPRALCLIRPFPAYRRESFIAGLTACGYHVDVRCSQADVLVIWNRYGEGAAWAERFEREGKPVIVAENGYLGREWRGGFWYALALSKHNGAGRWRAGDGSRWSSWNIHLPEWRLQSGPVVVLGSRGIGQPGVACPAGWTDGVLRSLRQRGIDARLRPHPGEGPVRIALEDDLRSASAVVAWGSGAAIKALALGVPVFYGLPNWIGALAARPFRGDVENPFIGDRVPMFESLAWAMWNVDEIAKGVPFRRLLCAES